MGAADPRVAERNRLARHVLVEARRGGAGPAAVDTQRQLVLLKIPSEEILRAADLPIGAAEIEIPRSRPLERALDRRVELRQARPHGIELVDLCSLDGAVVMH